MFWDFEFVRYRSTVAALVVGVMAEIDDPAPAHREIAVLADELGLELVAVGTPLYGVDPVDDPIAVIGDLGPGAVVLVKASRSAGLERVVDRLAGR